MSARRVMIGAIAALAVYGLQWLLLFFPQVRWNSPATFAGISMLVIVLLWIFGARKGSIHYTGIADFIIRIQNTPASRKGMQWFLHGSNSALYFLAGGAVGVEGAAMEWSHATAVRQQKTSAKWFEEWRRSDVSSSLAAGIAAAFGAPFAAVVLPLELTTGGRALGTVTAALSAFAFINLLEWIHPVDPYSFTKFFSSLDYSVFSRPDFYIALLVVTVLVTLVGWFLILGVDFCRSYVEAKFNNQRFLAASLGAVFILLVVLAFPAAHMSPQSHLAQLLDTPPELLSTGLHILSSLLMFTLVVGFIGTAGIFWPALALGALAGHLATLIAGGNSLINVMAGAACAWGVLVGAPVAGAVLAFEVSQNVVVLAPCLVAALLAVRLSRVFTHTHLIGRILESKGFAFERGRSTAILNSLMVADAMVTDHMTALEHDTVESLYQRLQSSRYPFVPVIAKSGRYLGMLTADIIEEAFQSRTSAEEKNITQLLEAKDLLYRFRDKVRPIQVDSSLGETYQYFEKSPVVPVLGDAQELLGLLFVYDVRIRYDQEVAKRRLTMRQEDTSDPHIIAPVRQSRPSASSPSKKS